MSFPLSLSGIAAIKAVYTRQRYSKMKECLDVHRGTHLAFASHTELAKSGHKIVGVGVLVIFSFV